MKRFISVFLAVILSVCLCGCSGSSGGDVSDIGSDMAPSSEDTVTDTSTSVSDAESDTQEKPVDTTSSVISEAVSSVVEASQSQTVSSEAPTPSEEVTSTPVRIGYDVPLESEVDWYRGTINTTSDYLKRMKFSLTNESGSFIKYLFHCPSYETAEAKPLFIFLHGLGGFVSMEDLGDAKNLVEGLIELENKDEKYAAYTLVPITPDGYEGWWTDTQISNFKKLIKKLIENYNIDPKRIYITGFSMGGMTTCRLVNEMPANTFAAAVPLAGISDIYSPLSHKNTAFRIYHATGDTTVSISSSRRLYQQLKDAGHPKVELIEFEGGHHKTPLDEVYIGQKEEFFEWIFAQKLP